jgi:hypothetical protein
VNAVRYVKVLDFQNDVEARLIEAHLQDLEIPHLVVSHHDSAYDGLFQLQLGWGHVEAPEEYCDRICEIYEDLTGTEPQNR